MTHPIPDHTERQRALDPSASFIVQAPAGSGKTELLTQRFLRLLACVNHPENIIALTFTRKAAQEMRHRIISALVRAQSGECPTQSHEKTNFELAQAALERNNALNWQLLENPNRLRIQTIDALCADLTRQLPLLAQFGAQPQITDDPFPFYRRAAQQFMIDALENTDTAPLMQQLLLHCDNAHNRCERLFMQLLARREQWLPYLINAKQTQALRAHLEETLQAIILDLLTALHAQVPQATLIELVELAQFAASTLEDQKNPITFFKTVTDLPSAQLTDLPYWHALSTLLLTKAGTWRKQITKNQGFPAASTGQTPEEKQQLKQQKARMKALLEMLAPLDTLNQHFNLLTQAPSPTYTDQQWAILETLIQLLPLLVAQLKVCFAQSGYVDFSEVSSAALMALGDADQPTDLALRLDYQLQHCLVDEFQDTSITQFALLEKLTRGWDNNDGRTLFLVGDPMQSIYRFRQAEVSLFLQAQQHGLGQVNLIPLHLKSNFRSTETLIQWVNQTFTTLFPEEDNPLRGAVPYKPSQAMHNKPLDNPIQCVYADSVEHEAQTLCEHIKTLLKNTDDDHSIAVLVKARSHLITLLEYFQAHQIPYQATEIQNLATKAIISDLLSLTRALYHPEDRIAWLSVLRSPVCGLTKSDFSALCEANPTGPMLPLLNDQNTLAKLSKDAQTRLQRVTPLLQSALQQRYRKPFKTLLVDTWLALEGPACVTTKTDLAHAETYFELLKRYTHAGDLTDWQAFNTKLMSLYAQEETPTTRCVNLMTIHKSKGLEFSSVFLPALERQPPIDSPPLLLWQDTTNTQGQHRFVLAPIHASDEDHDPIYAYLRQQDQQSHHYETARLLYVAATRSKERLILSTAFPLADQTPTSRSLLGHLWPALAEQFTPAATTETEETLSALNYDALTRLQTPQSIMHTLTPPQATNPRPKNGYQWTNESAARFGTCVHRLLADLDPTQFTQALFDNQKHTWRLMLKRAGLADSAIETSLVTLQKICHTLSTDDRAQWILNPTHEDAHNEYPLTVLEKGQPQQLILDRTFIADGVRWIIDYKITDDPNPNRYREQLNTYARAFAQKDPTHPLRCALYFPLTADWHSWDPSLN